MMADRAEGTHSAVDGGIALTPQQESRLTHLDEALHQLYALAGVSLGAVGDVGAHHQAGQLGELGVQHRLSPIGPAGGQPSPLSASLSLSLALSLSLSLMPHVFLSFYISTHLSFYFSGGYCTSSPCSKGGTCVEKVKGYECICPQGVHGVYCEYGGK